MEETRSMPSIAAKEILLNQTRRCRDRLQIVATLRDNVINAVDEASMAVSSIITSVEQAADTADATELKLLSKDLRCASNMVRRYENALENVLDVADMDDMDERLTIPNSAELEASAAARGSTGSLNRALSSSFDLHRLPSRFIDQSDAPSMGGTAVREAELISIDPELPSPDFLTAESCAASSFTDATSVDRLLAPSPMMPLIPLLPEPERNISPTAPISRPILGSIAAAAAALEMNSSPLAPPVSPGISNVDSPQVHQDFSMQAAGNEGTTTLSEGMGSTSTSGNLTSLDSVSSNGDVFVEGDSVQSGQFLYGGDDNFTVRFYMRHIVSPDEFYVQPVSHVASAVFAQLRNDLSSFYDDEDNHRQLFQDADCNANANIGRFGVYCRRGVHTYDIDKERVVVVGWRESVGANHYRGIQRYEAQIRFLDIGDKMWVSADQIWKIERRFCKVPALTIRCRLFDTRPREEGTATAFGVWSDAAIAKFKSLCEGDRPMSGMVTNNQEPVGLMLYVFGGSQRDCINAEMVVSRHAKTLTNWNRATTISAAPNQNRMPTAAEAALNLNVDFLCFGPEIPTLTPPAVGDIVKVDVQRWFNCCRFAVNFPQGAGDYARMQRDPQYKRERTAPCTKYVEALPVMSVLCHQDASLLFSHWPLVGALVAAKFSSDGRYYRARLLDVAPQEDSAHVRYVDYGNEQWVPVDTLRVLPPDFLELPYMAMECRLANIRPVPRALATNDAWNMFQEQISTLTSGKAIFAEVVHVLERDRPAGPVLSVILRSHDGSIIFNDFMVQNGLATRENM